MKCLAGVFLCFSLVAAVTPASAEEEDEETPAETWVSNSPKNHTKNIDVGVDALVTLPVGGLGDSTGPMVGGSLRLGAFASPYIEGYFRTGYLRGLTKTRSFGDLEVKTAVDYVPLMIGGRAFFLQPGASLYANAELGANVFIGRAEILGEKASSDAVVRFGMAAGIGYVVSKDVPIDLNLQLAALSLLSGNDALFGVTAGVGYAVRF